MHFAKYLTALFNFFNFVFKLLIMNKGDCIITYPVSGYKENTLKSIIRLGVNKVILIDEDESYRDLFNKFELASVVSPILTGV